MYGSIASKTSETCRGCLCRRLADKLALPTPKRNIDFEKTCPGSSMPYSPAIMDVRFHVLALLFLPLAISHQPTKRTGKEEHEALPSHFIPTTRGIAKGNMLCALLYTHSPRT
jgi:hypothetical protein